MGLGAPKSYSLTPGILEYSMDILLPEDDPFF